MPHSIFFTKQGHAIHGSYETKRLGMPVSHGCVRVRLHPANAAMGYHAFSTELIEARRSQSGEK
jgi:lipoprotein-anchoring transpeptidase ErfK/SrfK